MWACHGNLYQYGIVWGRVKGYLERYLGVGYLNVFDNNVLHKVDFLKSKTCSIGTSWLKFLNAAKVIKIIRFRPLGLDFSIPPHKKHKSPPNHWAKTPSNVRVF